MFSGFEKLTAIAGNGEGVGLEFKEFLTRETHLKAERRQTLACQMKYKLLQANGKAQVHRRDYRFRLFKGYFKDAAR